MASMSEKALLPQAASPPAPSHSHSYKRLLALGIFAVVALHHCARSSLTRAVLPEQSLLGTSGCVQLGALAPQRDADIFAKVNGLVETPEFKARAVDWLAGAVQVPTEVFDNMPDVGLDPRWEVFGPLHDYLKAAYPLVHSTLSLTKVNTYGLLLEWTGSDASLKPMLLAAHQDVVPVEPLTWTEWTHPPYSGYFDGEWIWGRGSADDKSGLIGILSAVETMISLGFKPTRTVVLAFGFDEEASGQQGAGTLGKAMEELYGANHPFAFVVDEGGGFAEVFGSVFAMPSIAEKGYLDVHVEVTSPGGHSSVPPEHTTIGMLARLLVEYEDNPYKAALSRASVPFAMLQCIGQHGATTPPLLKELVERSAHSDKALRALESVVLEMREIRALVGTTQAIDIVHGGVKSNALPEQAYAVVNHRIAPESSVREVMSHDTALLLSLAERFNLTYTAFGHLVSQAGAPALGTLTLSDAFKTALEPAPVSPVDSEAYRLLSGTIKATYAAKYDGEMFVSPAMGTGNTDTRYYWNLSRHIYRYNHNNMVVSEKGMAGAHTLNEGAELRLVCLLDSDRFGDARAALHIDALLEMIQFFVALILNADEATQI
ncbi:Gly-X carboxypeptidase [Mycena kentingensis (nom. inval.)]|nr:Gly-X carboxypeptidase [Mycena kentingensis (nom. inval.)]